MLQIGADDLDSFLSSLSMKVQVLAQDCGDTIESQMKGLLTRLPDMMTEVTELEGNMNELKKEIKEMTSATKNMEKNAQTEILSDLKTIQNKMKICKTQLETLTEWDQQCASCHDALSNQDTEMAASILEDMSRSVALLQGLPDQQSRVDSITTFKKELEEQLTPKLQTAFQSNNESQQLILHKIYSHLDLESQFVSAFCQFNSTAFSRILSSSIADSPFDTLQSFYPNLHTWFLSISEPLFTLFGDQDEEIIASLFDSGCRSISTEFRRVLDALPVASVKHALDASFGYMEILLGGVHGAAAKQRCFFSLLCDWRAFLTTAFVDGEYDALNGLLNAVTLTDDITTLVPAFCGALQPALGTLCLSLARFEEHCLTVGRGLLLPQYLSSLARLFGNVQSRYAALLDRYAALKKQEKEAHETAFDWSVFQGWNSLLVILNHFLLLLRHNQLAVKHFLQDNRPLFTALVTSETPGVSSFTSDALLLAMVSQDAAWRASITTLLSSLTTLPAGVMVSPLQAVYTGLLTLTSQLIDTVACFTLAPARHVFKQIPTMPQWSRVDASAVHPLPSEFILPLGEHLLKIVEQVEMAAGAASEGLQKVAVEAGEEWRSVLTEMERYGREEEKRCMKNSEVVLKRGYCSGMELKDPESFSQCFLVLVARLVIGSYIEAVCGINNIKISGSQQLATDIGYLSNVISAFGLGNASVLGVFKEVFALTDSELSQKLSTVGTTFGDEALILQRVARLRGALAC
ncbi:hypothetical protein WA577_003016 [Blastocystis sp. JDR]